MPNNPSFIESSRQYYPPPNGAKNAPIKSLGKVKQAFSRMKPGLNMAKSIKPKLGLKRKIPGSLNYNPQ